MRTANINPKSAILNRANYGCGEVSSVNGAHLRFAIAEQIDSAFSGHIHHLGQVGEEPARADDRRCNVGRFKRRDKARFRGGHRNMGKGFGLLDMDVSEPFYPGLHRFIEQVHVGLIVHILIGEAVALTGYSQSGHHDIDIRHHAAQRFRLRGLCDDELINRVHLADQSVPMSSQSANLVSGPMKGVDQVFAEVAGGSCNQHRWSVLRHDNSPIDGWISCTDALARRGWRAPIFDDRPLQRRRRRNRCSTALHLSRFRKR